jgi:hypothetical protein
LAGRKRGYSFTDLFTLLFLPDFTFLLPHYLTTIPMKLLFTLLNCLAFITAVAQIDLKFEAFGGMNMTRIRTSFNNYGSTLYVNNYKNHPQLGGQVGCLMSLANARFSPIVGVQFSRNTSYITMRYSSGYWFSTHTIRDIYYLKWDVVHTDFMLMIQAGLGADKNIRLWGGIALSSNLVNFSTQRYWLSTLSPYLPPEYTQMSGKVRISNLNTIVCSGIAMSVPTTKWSIQAVWRYCLQNMNADYGLRETGVQISLAYDLSEKLLRKRTVTTSSEN